MRVRKLLFLALGFLYRVLYLVPVIGDKLVRNICRAIAYVNYSSPYGIKHFDSMDEFRQQFERLVKVAGLPVKVTGHDEERLQLVVERCPYGFNQPGHMGVCDAAMDMDRKMFGYCGAMLVIDECIPDGFPVCKCSIYGPESAFVAEGGER
jgi:hypothetical protein